jgi:DNA topoisomerase-2
MGYFYKGGSFGTREDGGDEAADARYSETHLAWWIPYVYYKESVDIIERHIIEGDECEPYWLPGVIPMGIVNGTNGIATGFSTSSPPHNPMDVINYYIQKCEGKEPDPIMPWFNNFTGRREIKDRDQVVDIEEEILPKHGPLEALEKTNEDMDDEERDRDENDNMALLKHAESAKLSLRTYGKFSIEQARNDDIIIIRITELPIRSWSEHYKNWLQSMIDSKQKEKAVIDFENNSNAERPSFVIKWNKNYHKKPDIKSLRLVRSFGLSNITLINHKGFPTQYDKIQDIMDRYFDHMIEHYETLRKFRISNEENRMRDISYKMKYIVLVRKGDIKIVKVSEDIIKAKMKEFEIPYEYYEKSKGTDFSEEALERHKKHLDDSKAKVKLAEETTAIKIWLEKLSILKKEILKRKKGKFFDFSK